MNRTALCLLMLIAFVFGQGVIPHAHLEHRSVRHDAIEHHHHSLHVHSHVIGEYADTSHQFSEAAPIDLLKGAFSSHKLQMQSMSTMLAALFVAIFVVLWICIARLPPPVSFVDFGPPQRRHSPPRAPPR
jgi:hypothetical protein